MLTGSIRQLAWFNRLAQSTSLTIIERVLLLRLVMESKGNEQPVSISIISLSHYIGMDHIVVRRALKSMIDKGFIRAKLDSNNKDLARVLICMPADDCSSVKESSECTENQHNNDADDLHQIMSTITSENERIKATQPVNVNPKEHAVFQRPTSVEEGRRFVMHENWQPANIECYRTLLRLQRIPIDSVTEEVYQKALGAVKSRYIVQPERYNTDAKWTHLLVVQIAADMERTRSPAYKSVRSKVSEALMNIDNVDY